MGLRPNRNAPNHSARALSRIQVLCMVQTSSHNDLVTRTMAHYFRKEIALQSVFETEWISGLAARINANHSPKEIANFAPNI